MPSAPSVVFCTTCKGRVQHIIQTLPVNLSGNTQSKFVLLDYNSQDYLSTYLISKHRPDIESGRLIVYTMLAGLDGPIPFAMAHAKNMAHRCGILEGADILVNLDADNYAGDSFDRYILDHFQSGENIFLQAMWNRWVARRVGPEQDETMEWMAQDPSGEFGPPVPKGSNGRMVVSRDAFILAGGYHEKYDTWGPDDKDFNIRLRRLGFVPGILHREYQNTILHNDKVRFRDYPHAVTNREDDFRMTVEECNETVANFGQVGCGVVYRNFDFSNPIKLAPIPTRIFGIGAHKTATTSLHQALTILGYRSAHWKSAHWAKAIYHEMKDDGKSKTLEQSYALCDLPITVLYRELDAAYPGSKFILTIRDEQEWLRSVRNHWDRNINPYRDQWDNDPFTHFIHKQVYGRRDFDAETMLNTYRQHNADVLEYFKGRPGDFLVFQDMKWESLCRFLDQPVPCVDYPKMFITASAAYQEGATRAAMDSFVSKSRRNPDEK